MQPMIRFLSIVSLCCFAVFQSNAQTPYLEKDVIIRSGTYAYEELFKLISNQTGVVFSYTGFDDKQRISVKFDRQPLRIVLNTLFNNGNCTWKLKGKYVIVNCKSVTKPKPENAVASKSTIVVNGYILNAEDSTEIVESSVYLRQPKQSAITNEYGYFNMSFPKTADVLSISVAKEDFKDTTVVIVSKQQNTLVIYLQPKSAPISVLMNDSIRVTLSIDSVKPAETLIKDTTPVISPFWKRFGERRANLRNISDTLFTNVSFSLFPPISTNRLLSVNTVNKFSFNLLVGSSKGIDVFELGGLVNFDYGNVKYVQIGGLANLVSGTSTGVQVGGLINTVGKEVNGVQVAGLVNLDRGKVKSVQVAGIANLVKDTVTAVQIGGIANLNHSYTKGVQVAGIYNHSKNVFGGQIAGIANVGDTVSGAQISGLVNSARVIHGFQLSGLLNRAGKVKGSQLGFLNVADSITGIPVGFLSFVKTGYHKVELASDENLLTTLSFRTGVDAFHNILLGGVQIAGGRSLWTFGYGVGSAVRLGKKWYLDLDLTAQQLYLNNTTFSYNLLTKSFIGIEYRFGKNFSIAAGPTLNWYSSETTDPEMDPIWSKISQKTLENSVAGNYSNQLWIGAKLALRFF
ncbi:hypothetical protein [Fluviicola taffensis]|uniref:hypothetical protein n=1 Tax=Fluviicola taffensis TaxID=191579 RepID=UPI00313799CB